MARLEHVSYRCRIFVSYAHLDEKKKSEAVDGFGYPRAFFKYLRVSLKPLFEPERPEDYVFFDLNRLASEPAWGPAIENALNECELFIFLVSVNSLDSTYCMQKELSTAVKRGIPIIPVLLTPIDGWREYVLAGPDHPGYPPRRLSDHHTGGLPKDGTGNLRPVSQWKNDEELAWNSVCADIVTFIKARLKPMSITAMQDAVTPLRHAGVSRLKPSLLPYACDQVGCVDHNDVGFSRWISGDASTLLLILKGGYEDCLDRFVSQRMYNLISKRFSNPVPGLIEESPIYWPCIGPRESVESIRIRMGAALLEALGLATQPAFSGKTADCLRPELDSRPDAVRMIKFFLRQPRRSLKSRLLTMFPRSIQETLGTPSPAEYAVGLSEMVRHLQDAQPFRGKLLLVLGVEDIDELVGIEKLSEAWGLHDSESLLVMEPPPLKRIKREDAMNWHRQEGIEQTFGICWEDIDRGLFRLNRTHRLRSFAEHFERLLAQSRGDRP